MLYTSLKGLRHDFSSKVSNFYLLEWFLCIFNDFLILKSNIELQQDTEFKILYYRL